MTRKVKDVLAQKANENFVGRREEISVLLQTLADEGPFVTFVYGIGGIGKSSLLEAFAVEGRKQGATFVKLDCREIEPSEQGFLRELGAAIGGQVNTVEMAANRLESLGERVVLALDTYEVFRLMDTWLRRTFVPSLSDNLRVLLFGREAPVAAWRVSPGWQGLFQSIRLGPLPEADVLALLRATGLDDEPAQRVNRFSHGHPLALKLAIAAIAERPDLHFREIASQHVVAELTRMYLADVPDPLTREALEAASTLRRMTRSLLGAMLPDVAPLDAYERLAALPFAETGSDGLIIHDAVRQVIASTLKAADPNRYQLYRRAAWHQLRREVHMADNNELWRYTADMLYMIEEPIIREAFFPSDMQPHSVDPARPEDEAAILNIISKTEGPDAATYISQWWSVAPQTFRVIRDRDGSVAGFYIVLEPTVVNAALMQKDPLFRNWLRHIQEYPIAERQKVLFCRRWLAEEQGELPSPVQAAAWLDLKGLYMELRSSLRRLYCTAINADVYGPVLVKLGFQILPQAAVELDGQTYHTALLDFGPGLVNEEFLDFNARELILPDRRVGLTPLEFGVMVYLCDREGKVVTRNELLDTVWGYAYDGGSNVVDARVRALRKKLGDYAALIETVTGAGYRFRRRQNSFD
jgi:hypothetical protein